MRVSKSKVEQARESLLNWLKPGDTVYTILDHVSRSGMMRHVRLVVPLQGKDGSIDHIHPNYSASLLTGIPQVSINGRREDALKMPGCGTDMGFELVYNLGRRLWPHGFKCAGERCRSNDHFNRLRDRTGAVWHRGGGYALIHKWL